MKKLALNFHRKLEIIKEFNNDLEKQAEINKKHPLFEIGHAGSKGICIYISNRNYKYEDLSKFFKHYVMEEETEFEYVSRLEEILKQAPYDLAKIFIEKIKEYIDEVFDE